MLGSDTISAIHRLFKKLVKHLTAISSGKPNSASKKVINGYVATERYYNSKGEAYLDIDYTCHGNPKRHPYVPHIHRWHKNEAGILERGEWEAFQ